MVIRFHRNEPIANTIQRRQRGTVVLRFRRSYKLASRKKKILSFCKFNSLNAKIEKILQLSGGTINQIIRNLMTDYCVIAAMPLYFLLGRKIYTKQTYVQ